MPCADRDRARWKAAEALADPPACPPRSGLGPFVLGLAAAVLIGAITVYTVRTLQPPAMPALPPALAPAAILVPALPPAPVILMPAPQAPQAPAAKVVVSAPARRVVVVHEHRTIIRHTKTPVVHRVYSMSCFHRAQCVQINHR